MNFRNPVYTEKTQCQDCYKCVRECPVKGIRVESGHATVVPELCVLCGHCVTVCPAEAKRVRDDLARARQLLTLRDRVIVSLAPSFVSEFPGVDPRALVGAIMRLGFSGVSETAIGADLVSAHMAEILSDAALDEPAAARDGKRPGRDDRDGRRGPLYISSACPAAVEFIKRYMGELTPYVADCASPLLAHARFLARTFGPSVGVVFIGPCIAKKREADVLEGIDCAISFRDLRRWLADEGIDLASSATDATGATGADFIPYRAAKGALYPVDGGMIASMRRYPLPERSDMMAVSGLESIEAALRGLDPATLERPLFVEALACPGGCVAGPQSSRGSPNASRRIAVSAYARSAEDTLRENRPPMAGALPAARVVRPALDEDELRAALRLVGKLSVEDELNCGGCGYDTCRGFASAMLERRAEKTMCVSYMRKLAQKKANGLIRAIPSGVVICDSSLRVIECNENFAALMGPDVVDMYEARPGLEGADLARITTLSNLFRAVMEEGGPDSVEHEVREGRKIFHATVFSIEKGDSACGVVQDVTAPQIRKDRVIRQARRVIDKNLAVVQKIAFLLGENAAETESTLNSIIESFSGDEEGKE